MIDPSAATKKWQQNLAASGATATAGANAVTQSPTALAALAVDKQVAGVQRAAASGKTASALNKVTREQWIQAYVTKGVPRLASGAAAGAPKYQQFAQKFYPVMAQASQAAKAIPNNSIEDALNRVRTVIQAAKAFAASNQ